MKKERLMCRVRVSCGRSIRLRQRVDGHISSFVFCLISPAKVPAVAAAIIDAEDSPGRWKSIVLS